MLELDLVTDRLSSDLDVNNNLPNDAILSIRHDNNRRGVLEENKEILSAYQVELDEEGARKRREKIYKKWSNIYVKQIKLMNELWIWFFHPIHDEMFSELAKLSGRYTFDSEKDVKIGTALSYLGLFLVHAAKIFNVWLRYPIWFNGIKSYIIKDQYRQYSLHPSRNSTQTTLRYAITMLAENIQFLWSYIASMSKNNTDLLGDNEFESIGLSKMSSNVNSPQKYDDLHFSNDSIVLSNDVNMSARTQIMQMDSNLTGMETMDEDSVALEQSKMLENLMNIVEFILK